MRHVAAEQRREPALRSRVAHHQPQRQRKLPPHPGNRGAGRRREAEADDLGVGLSIGEGLSDGQPEDRGERAVEAVDDVGSDESEGVGSLQEAPQTDGMADQGFQTIDLCAELPHEIGIALRPPVTQDDHAAVVLLVQVPEQNLHHGRVAAATLDGRSHQHEGVTTPARQAECERPQAECCQLRQHRVLPASPGFGKTGVVRIDQVLRAASWLRSWLWLGRPASRSTFTSSPAIRAQGIPLRRAWSRIRAAESLLHGGMRREVRAPRLPVGPRRLRLYSARSCTDSSF